ncbi:MAG: hypothetical protein AB1664_00670 [Thermodesulfobacteriota bacterium]
MVHGRKKSKIIHRSKIPHVKGKRPDLESPLLSALKAQERELLDTQSPAGDAAKQVILGETPRKPVDLILPDKYRNHAAGLVDNGPRIVVPGQITYRRGDIIEYPDGKCRYHVVVSHSRLRGVIKIPCYTMDSALIVSRKLRGQRVQPLSDAEKQKIIRREIAKARQN